MGVLVRVWDALDGVVNTVHVTYFISGLIVFLILSSAFFGITVSSNDQPLDTPIECVVYFSEPILLSINLNNKSYTEVLMDDCVSQSDEGSPSLPVYTARILIPYGKSVSKVQVSAGHSKKVSHDFVNNPVLPEQKHYPLSMKPTENVVIINKTRYNSIEPVNKKLFVEGEVGYCRGYEIYTVYLNPVVYIPKTGKLSYYTDMTVKVHLTDKQDSLYDEAYLFLRGTESDKSLIDSTVENPQDIESYDFDMPLDGDSPLEYLNGLCDPSDNYQYVIITSESLKDTNGYKYNWSDLISHRQSFSGLSGIIVTVEEIDACTDYWNETAVYNDTQAHIREFLKDAYNDWGTQYVILGGDWDSSNQIVPYRLFTDRYESGTYDTMACDKYYSHLDGTWYYSSQSIWGGGKGSGVNDYYGELYVGRIAAYNASMVSNAVYKIINYDTNESLTDEWLSTASFGGGDLGWTSTSKQYMEEIRLGTDTYRTFTGFEEWNSANPSYLIDTSERLYHADLGSSYTTSFSNSIKNDNASMINHIDHSSWNTPFGLTNWLYRYNTKPFFGYTQGCLAGRFHSGYSGSEQLMCRHEERHAYALILNTGYGYGSTSSTNGQSQYIHAFFWDYFFNEQENNQENWQLGKAFVYSADKMASKFESSSAAWCYAWYSAHFFGDPAQTLRLSNSKNKAVELSSPSPSDGSTGVSILTSSVSVSMQDPDGNLFNWSIETSPNIGYNSSVNAVNGTKTCLISDLSYSTTYTWYVNVTDGISTTNASYTFTTESQPVDHPPQFSNPVFVNGSTSICISISNLSITINDPEGNLFNYSIETSPNIGSFSENEVSNGTKSCSVSGLAYSTEYTWYVNATDGNSWKREWYTFTTREVYTPNAPADFAAIAVNRTSISLSWDNHPYASSTLVEWHVHEDGSWNIGDHTGLYNGSAESTLHTELSPETTIYYKAWSWNETDNSWSSGSTSSATTSSNSPPSVGAPSPLNYSIDQELSLIFSILISDADSDLFNWTIECSNGQSNFGNDDSAGDKQLLISGLDFGLQYVVWVNATDSYDTSSFWFVFTTRNEFVPAVPGSFTAVAVNRSVISLSWNHGVNSSKVYVRYNTSDYPYDRDSGIYLCNSSGSSINVEGLSFGTQYFFSAWSWNETDNIWSLDYSYADATTEQNYAPNILSPSPGNGSTGVSISTSGLSVTISDFEGDLFNWSIETSPNIGYNSAVNAVNGTKTCLISDLSYSTTYTWYVNVTDGINSRNVTYFFTTSSAPAPPSPPPSGGGAPLIINQPPTADPGGPYIGLVDEVITFIGNASADTDGTIVSYEWMFGDGSNASGEIVYYSYSTAGVFTVSLTVVDNGGLSSTASTSASIYQTAENTSNATNPEESVNENTEDDSPLNNFLIVNEIKNSTGLNLSVDAFIYNVSIDDSYFFLVDTNGDGVFDLYFNVETKTNSFILSLGDGIYLIDKDGDGSYDYIYNAVTNIMSAYEPLLEESLDNNAFLFVFFRFGLIVLVIIIVLVLFVKKSSIELVLLNKKMKKLKHHRDQFYYMHVKRRGLENKDVDEHGLLKSDEIFTGRSVKKLYEDSLKKSAFESKEVVSELGSDLKSVMTKEEFIFKIRQDIDNELKRLEEEQVFDINTAVDLIISSRYKVGFEKI